MKKKINDLKDLEIARLQAKLKAAESLRQAKEAATDIMEDFNSIASVGKTVKKFIRPDKSKSENSAIDITGSGLKQFDGNLNELGLDLFLQLRNKGVSWQSVIFPLGIWLIKNGYLEHIASTKKSEIYAILLSAVKKARARIKKS